MKTKENQVQRVGWSEHYLGELFSERREPGISGLPILSVTMNSGVVARSDLGRRIESELADESHALVRKNDIAYNMMRMWQGVSGLAPCDGLVSPAYVVLNPSDRIDPLFASYLFKMPETIRLFHRFSQGLTDDRLRLYFDQFSAIRVNIPDSVEPQRNIASLISTFDERISQSEATTDFLRFAKHALCQDLLS